MKPNQLKICVEESCGNVYVPDNREGRCPRCNSEGIWLCVILDKQTEMEKP